jgi:hypothetical protein
LTIETADTNFRCCITRVTSTVRIYNTRITIIAF